MTNVGLSYLQLQEAKRSNLAKEAETNRSNLANEMETNRANLAKEGENYRSNVARETETHRANVANETETHRANVARETETNRSNVAKEVETNRANVAKEAETNRANTVSEAETRRKNDQTHWVEAMKLLDKDEELRQNAVKEVHNFIANMSKYASKAISQNLADDALMKAGAPINMGNVLGSARDIESLIPIVNWFLGK